MSVSKQEDWFKHMECIDTCIEKKKCAFYWQECDYWGEYDEGCYWGSLKPEYMPKTRLVCILPYFIQKIIYNKIQRKDIDDFVEYVEQTRGENDQEPGTDTIS